MKDNEVNYNKTGLIFNIQRFSVNDGPGVRTIVFLKGCPLSCLWCSNPESQHNYKEIMFNENNCTGCNKCEKNCTHNGIDFNIKNRIDREKCINCGDCTDECYREALVMSGEEVNVSKVIEEVKKDDMEFRHSGGGITLSGGEPLMQPEFALELLRASKYNGWNTTIETTGFTSKEVIDKVMPWVDLVLLDIKTTDLDKHIEYVGKSNEIILENAKRISELGTNMIIRVPIIPEFNADFKSVKEIAEFVKNLKMVKEMHILPYHRLGVNKYNCLGREYKMKDSVVTPSDEFMEELKGIVEKVGVKCNIGAI